MGCLGSRLEKRPTADGAAVDISTQDQPLVSGEAAVEISTQDQPLVDGEVRVTPRFDSQTISDPPEGDEMPGHDASLLPEEELEDEKIKAAGRRARRRGVAAESVPDERVKNYVKPVHPKDDDQKESLITTLKSHPKMQVLFGHLDAGKLLDVVNAFYFREFHRGADIIKQGADGECLYIIISGEVDVFVRRAGSLPEDGKGPKVASLGPGMLFGELALMYNEPRAATINASTEVVETWVLDATDFKMLLAQNSQAQYAKYEGWLSEVQLFKLLNHHELGRLADILESEHFGPGEDIIKQNEPGDKFYLMEDGTAAAYMSGEDGEKLILEYKKKGDYFGEVALLKEVLRKASVRATGEGCVVASVSKGNFTAILGPITDILKDHVDKYSQYADFLY